MFEAQHLRGNTYYFNLPAKVGAYVREDGETTLIDSGSDPRIAERIARTTDENGWRVTAVIDTHCHADHTGGNAFWEARGAVIFAADADLPIVRQPMLNPELLYGGYPHGEYFGTFLLAKPSDAKPFTDPAFPRDLEILPLPGHSIGMVGVRTKDDVLFIGDMTTASPSLEKYGMPFLYDVGAYLETAEKLMTVEAKYFVPAHASVVEDIRPLLAENVKNVNDNLQFIRNCLQTPMRFDDLLARYFTDHGLFMNLMQNYLVSCTMRSYLSYLSIAGEVREEVRDNRIYYLLK